MCASKKLPRIGGRSHRGRQPTATGEKERARGREALVGYLGMQGQGCPGGSRLVGVDVELVGLGVESPDEEEAGDGGGEEDEDHPQRAHLLLSSPGSCSSFSPDQGIEQSINLAWMEGNRSQERRRLSGFIALLRAGGLGLWPSGDGEKRKSNGGLGDESVA